MCWMRHVVHLGVKKSSKGEKRHVLSLRYPLVEEQKKRDSFRTLSFYTALYNANSTIYSKVINARRNKKTNPIFSKESILFVRQLILFCTFFFRD